MTLGDGFPAVSGTVDSTELRKALAGLILRDTSGNARAGVFPRHTSALVSSKASMAVDVAAFEGVTVRGGGPIFMANDGTVAVTIDAAPGSNSRIDVVYFKQNESASPYSDANNLPVLAVAKGTAGAVPVKPTIPTGAVELATILIPSGVSATNAGGVVITQTAPYTTVTGSPLPVRLFSELAALTSFTSGTRVRARDRAVTLEYLTTGDGVAANGWYPISGRVPRCELAVAGLSVSNGGAGVAVTTWTETSDPWAMHDLSVNPARVTAPAAGRYMFTLIGAFANNTTNLRIMRVLKNTTVTVGYSRTSATIVPDQQPSISGEAKLAAGDYFSVEGLYQDSGGALTFSATFTVSYLGPA